MKYSKLLSRRIKALVISSQSSHFIPELETVLAQNKRTDEELIIDGESYSLKLSKFLGVLLYTDAHSLYSSLVMRVLLGAFNDVMAFPVRT